MGSPGPRDTFTHIRDQAVALFARQGYSGTSMQEIADAAGVSKANIFHHFRSKRELYRAVVEAAHHAFETDLRNLPPAGLSPGRVSAVSAAHLDYLARESDVIRLVMRELLDPAGELTQDAVGEILNGNFKRLIRGLSGKPCAPGPERAAADTALLVIAANLLYFLMGSGLNRLDGFQDLDRAAFTRWVGRVAFAGSAAEVSP